MFRHFVAADSASEAIASLKRIHGLMPYFVLKGILKISNPIGMIRGGDQIPSIFMAHETTWSSFRRVGPVPRPAVPRSKSAATVILVLFAFHEVKHLNVYIHSMFTSSLAEEAKALREDIESVRDKVEDPVLCEKIRLFVYAPTEIQDMLKADAGRTSLDSVHFILIKAQPSVSCREHRYPNCCSAFERGADTLASATTRHPPSAPFTR